MTRQKLAGMFFSIIFSLAVVACGSVEKGGTGLINGPTPTTTTTPPPTTPPTGPTGPTNPSGETAEQALATCQVSNSPADVASWDASKTSIGKIVMRPSADPNAGLEFFFSKRGHGVGTWPDWTPPGWEGPIQYTVWAGVKINGQWYCSGIIEMWWDRVATGAPILTDFARNWVYDSRWGGMAGYQPRVGERMFFFVSAGDARGFRGVTSVRERSPAVFIDLPAGDSGTFTFSQGLVASSSSDAPTVVDEGRKTFMTDQERRHRDDRREF